MLIRRFHVLLVVLLTTSPAWAQHDPFLGQWKLTKLTDQMIVTPVGANKYAFDFGGGVETVVANGTFQPASAGTTLFVATVGPNWKVVRKKGGRTLLSATWSLSKDGNSLHDDFTSFGPDGSPSNVQYVYDRKAAGSRFAGTWVSTTSAIKSVIILQVRPYANNGLSFIIPSQRQKLDVNFDGSSARRLNARTVEIHRKVNRIALTEQFQLSPDLKTLTTTVHSAGRAVPDIYVYERQ